MLQTHLKKINDWVIVLIKFNKLVLFSLDDKRIGNETKQIIFIKKSWYLGKTIYKSTKLD
jgi:hypothetical protein